MEFWLISAPGNRTPQQTWEKLNQATVNMKSSNSVPMSHNYKFNLPDLKVGTLDSLIGISDELVKLDSYTESIAKKLSTYMADILEEQRDKLAANLTVNGESLASWLNIVSAPLPKYLCHFQWDLAKYPSKLPLGNIAEIISKTVSQVETDLKSKSQAYNQVKTNLKSIERKATGSVLLRNLGDIVRKEDFILGSEYLTTILVAVPVVQFNEWNATYEKLTDFVVPRSSRLLYEDSEYGLYSVTIFQKVLEEFKYNCAKNKFFVRDFQYNEQDMNADKTQLNKLTTDKKKMLGPLLRWLKVNFGEIYIAWIHVKAMRVFVESVLRYGLPVNFQAMVLQPQKKANRRLREALQDLYKDLDSSGLSNINEEDIGGMMPGIHEYYPYVYYKIFIDFVQEKPHH